MNVFPSIEAFSLRKFEFALVLSYQKFSSEVEEITLFLAPLSEARQSKQEPISTLYVFWLSHVTQSIDRLLYCLDKKAYF